MAAHSTLRGTMFVAGVEMRGDTGGFHAIELRVGRIVFNGWSTGLEVNDGATGVWRPVDGSLTQQPVKP